MLFIGCCKWLFIRVIDLSRCEVSEDLVRALWSIDEEIGKTWCGLCEHIACLVSFWAKSSVELFFVCRFGSLCLFESMAVVAFFVKVGLRLCWLYVLHLCSTGQVLSDGAFKCSYVSVLQRLVPAVKSEANGWRRLRCCWRMKAQICCAKTDASGRWRSKLIV